VDKQRPALLALRDALGCRDSALRRDECGDWRIAGRFGHIHAVPGSLDRFQIFIAGSVRWWANAKAALKLFADLANDGDDEGVLFFDRLPTAEEAETIRHYVGLAKKRVLSDEERERLASLGLRFQKRSDVEGAQTGQKPASDDTAGLMPADRGEGEI
jgi:hypothetical protein